MSTRVVNDSVKKPEAGKSSKAVVNTGYELVQHTKGRKSPSASGYHVPDTRAVGGYELVKSPAGKRTTATQKVDVDERPMDKEIEKPKRDVVLVIAIIIVVVLTVVTILSVTIAFLAISVKEPLEPLPDLTELCRTVQTAPGVDINCYYHFGKYPDDCAGAFCSAMGVQLQIDEKSFKLKDVSISTSKLTKIPNQTPCAAGKWCQEGVCVETKDPRVKKYNETKPVDSYWVNSCERPQCIFMKSRSTSKARLENLTGECIDESKCVNPDVQKVAFGYRYCTIPRHGGRVCQNYYLPIHVIKNCGSCSSTTVNNTTNTLLIKDCFKDKKISENGVPCDYEGSTGFCFQGVCVSDGSNDQKCLTKMNSTTN